MSTTASPSKTAPAATAPVVADASIFHGNTTNCVLSLADPTTASGATAATTLQWSNFYKESEDVFSEFYTFELQQKQAAEAMRGVVTSSSNDAAVALGADKNISATGAQLAAAMVAAIQVPKGITIPPPTSGAGGKQLSAVRQLSGQLDAEVARSWDEDWEDEDVDDGFDVVMAKIAKGGISAAL